MFEKTRPRSFPTPSLLLIALSLCALPPIATGSPREGPPMLRISSSAFASNQQIPAKFTCDGEDVSPPLWWDGAPADAQSFVLLVDDPDAPDPAAPRGAWVHWVLIDIPVLSRGLPEAMRELPPGTLEGINDFQRIGYSGPCPPVGRHRYFFKLYALDTKLKLIKADKSAVQNAMRGHVVARAVLVGTYEKPTR
jgi:Raf kinase inhibitor-like YbhB/YbcL family protein